MSPTAPVTVIVPVYRDVAAVARCIDSVLRHRAATATPHQVLVIDDCSPEEEVRAHLAGIAGTPDLTVVTNDRNLGFVGSVNRGIGVAEGDVVLLNADTVVTAGWLDRLADAAAGADVATVTPLTNFGSICTLPHDVIEAFALDGPDPAIDECAALLASSATGARPEVISGVGFCLYITRAALDACGTMDEQTFGPGYGEEVDFCLRATRVGFRHLVEDATFVYHQGGVSFGDEGRSDGLARGSSLLHERYPFFRAANQRERRRDPLAVTAAALDLGMRARDESRPHVLHLVHEPSRHGGTEHHMDQLMSALADEFDFSVLSPVDSGFQLTTRWRAPAGEPIEHRLLLPGAARRVTSVHDDGAGAALELALDLFDFDAVHIQNLIGHSLAPLGVLASFGGPVVCSVRDLYLACPHHWLLYENDRPCGLPDDPEVCARCLPVTQGHDLAYLERFRSEVTRHHDVIDRWVFASTSAERHLRRLYDIEDARVVRIPHGALIDVATRTREVDEQALRTGPLRLALVGRGWKKKGLTLVNGLAEQLVGTDIELHHFGEAREPVSPRVTAHGAFESHQLADLLHEHGIAVVLLPGPYAETFSHAMTEVLLAGRPVIGNRHGAVGERIRATGVGWTVEPSDTGELRRLIENLDRARSEVVRATRCAVELPIPTLADTAPAYAELYRPMGPETRIRQADEPEEHSDDR